MSDYIQATIYMVVMFGAIGLVLAFIHKLQLLIGN